MLTFILGGARSGKSELAVRLAQQSGLPVLFIATMDPQDDEMRARVAAHRELRPESWSTVETTDEAILGAVQSNAGPRDFIIIDCITLWISNLLIARFEEVDVLDPEEQRAFIAEVVGYELDLLSYWASTYAGEVAIVSNEVGHGVVPPYPLGRVFRDAVGAANKMLAYDAERAYYVVAGMALDLRQLGTHIANFGGEP